jgi:hypothetical protein
VVGYPGVYAGGVEEMTTGETLYGGTDGVLGRGGEGGGLEFGKVEIYI